MTDPRIHLDPDTSTSRDAAIRDFVRETFGLRGTLRLHRAAFGGDLLRAPVNVLLAPIFVLVRLAALIAGLVGLHGARRWLLDRRILLVTQVARAVEARVLEFLSRLNVQGIGVAAPQDAVRRAVADYVGVRSAVSEMTTALIVLVSGVALFHAATPGVLSLTGPLAQMRAEAAAIRDFPLGSGLGRAYYAMFPVEIPLAQVLLTGVVLAMLASVITTFAGVLADPLQVSTGTHRRRIARLLARLDAVADRGQGLAREHLAARLGDASDVAMSLWRFLRG
ncbi:DUF6635 family protein [Sulfitobacter sp. D35]|uniref:DUF6635 family protein n=1 Tax=Sulfitobacter sp. D35 TaxID=3083252 RepID=UPI00296F2836|nr:DUF6635 family protein [Sulfitobacter sp. D35]MDW4499388.1 DUF6635 family protein [Sulfitobacter sp. D35]